MKGKGKLKRGPLRLRKEGCRQRGPRRALLVLAKRRKSGKSSKGQYDVHLGHGAGPRAREGVKNARTPGPPAAAAGEGPQARRLEKLSVQTGVCPLGVRAWPSSRLILLLVSQMSCRWNGLATGLESPESFTSEHQVEVRSEAKHMRMQFVRDPSSDGRQTDLHLVASSPSPISSYIFSAQHVLHPSRGMHILLTVRSSRETDSLLCPMAAPLRLRRPRALHLQGSVRSAFPTSLSLAS